VSKNRIAFVIAALMFAASVGAMVARPSKKLADDLPTISLEAMIPKQFGDWREEPARYIEVVNPEAQALLDKLYSEVLSRTYVNSNGYRIMLSLAYGSDQRGSLQAHRPEVCYPAQGFKVEKNERGRLVTPFGEIPVRRLYTHLGARHEPVTYWFAYGGYPLPGLEGSTQRRIVDLRYGLTGRIPDGLLFRVSSIDRNVAQAHQIQDQFINHLLQATPPADRKRLSGLGDS